LTAEEAEAQLIELGLDLGRLDNILDLRVGIILDTDLFVANTGDCDTDLELTSDFAELFRFRVTHDDPFVKERVIGLLIQVTEIKLVITNERVFKKALVHKLDLNLGLLELFCFEVLGFKENVFVPVSNTCVVDVVLS
jgi:hypothetical protein